MTGRNWFHRWKKDSRKGYTLVELIVVIVILLVLTASMAVGITTWMNWSHFKKQNEYAKSLFAAAQNQMTQWSSQGQLDMVRDSVSNRSGYVNRLDVTSLKDENGQSYKLDKVWPNSQGKTGKEAMYRGEIVSVIGTAEDYRKYKAGESGLAKEKELLYDMLMPYLYDPSILDSTICVEFAPEDGQIFAVLYSDRAEGFAYDDSNENHTGVVDITSRQTEERKKRMVGYYGVDTLSKSTTTEEQKPTISDVKLNNENTLNLTFRLSKNEEALKLLTYEITLYDKISNKKKLRITLDGTQGTFEQEGSLTQQTSCNVSYFMDDGSTRDRTYPFVAWYDRNATIHLILDGADLSATAHRYKNAKDELKAKDQPLPDKDYLKVFVNSTSIKRLGLDFEDLYCEVQASGSYYAKTSKKRSNSSNACFAAVATKGGRKTYDIANFRHLYNVRYMEEEKENPGDVVQYQLTRNISWSSFVKGNGLYDTKDSFTVEKADVAITPNEVTAVKPATGQNVCFPSLPTLTKGSILSGGSGAYVIQDVSMTERFNGAATVYGTKSVTRAGTPEIEKIENGAVGLVVENQGTMENLKMDKVSAQGTTNVGAFCGVNGGALQSLTVNQSDSSEAYGIRGDSQVGGVVGSTLLSGDDASMTYSKLTNRARVQGKTHVGGITGQISVEKDQKIVMDSCKNYGAVEGLTMEEGDPKESVRFLGGIVGSAINDGTSITQDTSNGILLKDCISSPQYVNLQLTAEQLKNRTNGSFVGGVAGYVKNGCLSNCSTQNERGNQGYVFGDRYVGGIVGFYDGANGVSLDGDNLATADKTERSINETHVVGNAYVGGICGFNGVILLPEGVLSVEKMTDEQIQEKIHAILTAGGTENGRVSAFVPDLTKNEKKILNWDNRGMAIAFEECAGGVTGANTGTLVNVKSTVESVNVTRSLADAVAAADESAGGTKSKNVGGITGYNSGLITKAESTNAEELKTIEDVSVVCYVAGADYVGGIAGYNAPTGDIVGYRLEGGFVRGKDVFVGGYVGLNASEKIFGTGKDLIAHPNQVEGKYFVGGILGGNVIAIASDASDKQVKTDFDIDNFLGNVKGEAFVGGFIGYNRVYEFAAEEGAADAETDRANNVWAACERAREAVSVDEGDVEARLTAVVQRVDSLTAVRPRALMEPEGSQVKMTISGVYSDKSSQVKFGGIESKIYVGGVIGYNSDDSVLEIKDVLNKTPVSATFAIANEEETLDMADGSTIGTEAKEHRYSYAGGIIGKVGTNVTVSHCKNQDIGDVVSQGDYLGGICEINEGTIQNCEVSSIGSDDKSYVGGIVGLNKGEVEGCSFLAKTITGKDYVGGIAAENLVGGTIRNSRLTGGIVRASGSDAGGIVGINYGDVFVDPQLTDPKDESKGYENLSVTVYGSGSRIGGVAGTNYGTVGFEGENKDAAKEHFDLTGVVLGDSIVGGLVGCNEKDAEPLSYLNNGMAVKASHGEAGGIAGASQTDIDHCTNHGSVSSTESENAGGIVAHNEARISDCVGTRAVSADNGDAGGIAAINTPGGTIENCVVKGTEDSRIVFEGYHKIGGVAGVNEGTMTNVQLEYVDVQDVAGSDYSWVGIVTGYNRGTIDNSEILREKPSEETTDGAAEETTEGSEKKASVRNCNIRIRTTGGDAGGVAGVNEGTIKGVFLDELQVELDVTHALYANMGGVAGVNKISDAEPEEGTESESKAATIPAIEDCTVVGSVIGRMGRDDFGYGGVTGRNEGTVTGCDFSGDLWADGSSDNVVNLGGTVGMNTWDGVVSHCYVGTRKDTDVTSGKRNGSSGMGQVGGMVGVNYGSVLTSANHEKSNHKVTVTNFSGHMGGLVGEQKAGATISGTEEEYLSTGENWTVISRKYSNDAGTGGIIGYCASGNDIRYVKNYADVKLDMTTIADNVTCGGLMGRMENRERIGTEIRYFENHGDINGAIAGGMIGRLKYKGLYVRDCVNTGQITSPRKIIAGGLIASCFANDAGSTLMIESSRNHGSVSCPSSTSGISGGIVGERRNSASISILMTDCVNTGQITGGSIGGMIYGYTNSESFYRCRNYGNLGESGGTKRSGIAVGHTGAKMEKCFNFGNNRNLTDNSNPTKSYFLQGPQDTSAVEDAKKVPKLANEGYFTTYNGRATPPTNARLEYVTNILKQDKQTVSFQVHGCKPFQDYNLTAPRKPDEVWFRVTFDSSYDLTAFWIYWSYDAGNRGIERVYRFRLKNQDGKYLDKSGRWSELDKDDEAVQIFNQTGSSYENMMSNPGACKINLDGTPVSSIVVELLRVADGAILEDSGKNDKNLAQIYCLQAQAKGGEPTHLTLAKNHSSAPVISGDDVPSSKGTATYWTEMEDKTYAILDASGGKLLDQIAISPSDAWSDTGSEVTGARYRFYKDVDPKVKTFYEEESKKEPTGVTNLTVNNQDGVIRAKWNLPSDGNYYKTQIRWKLEGETEWKHDTLAYGINNYTLSILPEWCGKKLQVQVRTINGVYGDAVPGDKTNNTSAWVSKEVKVDVPLKNPKFHLELGAFDKDGNSAIKDYVIILDNPEDYVDEKGNSLHATIQLDVKVGSTTKQVTVAVSDGRSEHFGFTNKGNITLTAKATTTVSGYTSSSPVTVQSSVYGGADLTEKNIVNTTFNDFYGSMIRSMYNQLSITNNYGNQCDVYVNSELSIDDYSFALKDGTRFTCPVTIARGTSHVNQGNDASNPSVSNLNNLPDNLMDYGQITVRAVPWQMQSYVAWYGHVVKENVAWDELAGYLQAAQAGADAGALKDQERKGETVFTKSGLSKGYVLSLNSDGTYTITYNVLLANDADTDYGCQIAKRIYQIDKKTNKVTWEKKTKNIAPAPDVVTTQPLDEDGKSYVFRWDEGQKESEAKDARYQIQLTGIATDAEGNERRVVLGSEEVNQSSYAASYVAPGMDGSKGYWTYTFVDQEEIWNYAKVEFNVMRIGTTDGNDRTNVFPSTTVKEYPIKLRMSQLSRPTVALHVKESGEVDKDRMVYDVSFLQVPMTEREALAGYQVRIASEESNGHTVSFGTTEERDLALEKLAKLHEEHLISEEGAGEDSEEKQSRTYVWESEEQGGKVSNTLVVSWTKNGTSLTRKLIKLAEFPYDLEKEQNQDPLIKQVDLSDFANGETVTVSVKAIARADDVVYRDGPEGVARELYLPTRHGVPDVGKLQATEEYQYDPAGSLTMEEFLNNGIWICMKDETASGTGTYQIAVAVYDEKEENADQQYQKLPEGDASAEAGEDDAHWNAGAIQTLIGKESDEGRMTGNFNYAEYNLGLDTADYAGKWLKIVVRKVSDSNVSSWWSDEDETVEETVNHAWIRIPRVQVDQPFVSETDQILYYGSDGRVSMDQQTPDDVGAGQIAMSHGFQPYAEGYVITRVRTQQAGLANGMLRHVVDFLYLEAALNEENQTTYHVFANTSDEAGLTIPSQVDPTGSEEAPELPTCRQDETAQYVGTIEPNQLLVLPFAETAMTTDSVDVGTEESQIRVHMALFWEQTAEVDSMNVILPDVLVVNPNTDVAFEGAQNRFTNQLTLRAVVTEEANRERYADSKTSSWYQTYSEENKSWVSEVKTAEEWDAATGTVWLQKAAEPYVYQVQIQNVNQYPVMEYVLYTEPDDFTGVPDPAHPEDAGFVPVGGGRRYASTDKYMADSFAAYDLDVSRHYAKVDEIRPEKIWVRVRFAFVYGSGGGLGPWSEWSMVRLP